MQNFPGLEQSTGHSRYSGNISSMIEWNTLGFPNDYRPQFEKFNFFTFSFVVWLVSTPLPYYPHQAEKARLPSVQLLPGLTATLHSSPRFAPRSPLLRHLLAPCSILSGPLKAVLLLPRPAVLLPREKFILHSFLFLFLPQNTLSRLTTLIST